jgi:hypothetical protein
VAHAGLRLCLVLSLGACAPPAPSLSRDRQFQRGVALGLFDEDWAMGIDEIASLDATDISLVVTWVQDDVEASLVRAQSGYTPSNAILEATIRRAHARGLRITLFPILRLIRRTPAEWRGVIRPRDPARWFASYSALVERLARLGRAEGVERLSVGSELASLEGRDEWHALIAGVRKIYGGTLLYSANWDRYSRVPFWRDLDQIGISAYWELIAPGRAATLEEALAAWRPIRNRLDDFAREMGRPIVLTEVGYPSVEGGGSWPWNDFLEGPAGRESPEAQRRLYEAFTLAFTDAERLAGVYFWFWIAPGGAGDRGYTPRHKPAEWVIRNWYRRADRAPYP